MTIHYRHAHRQDQCRQSFSETLSKESSGISPNVYIAFILCIGVGASSYYFISHFPYSWQGCYMIDEEKNSNGQGVKLD